MSDETDYQAVFQVEPLPRPKPGEVWAHRRPDCKLNESRYDPRYESRYDPRPAGDLGRTVMPCPVCYPPVPPPHAVAPAPERR